jgi:hypothetical protein
MDINFKRASGKERVQKDWVARVSILTWWIRELELAFPI